MTSLKGNLNSVDLANIFQMLSMNQREGTLYILDGQGRTAIYFGREGVSMLSRGKGRQDSLGRILIRQDLITREQLEEGLARQGEGAGRMLGQVLVEQGVISRQQVEEALRVQIEEEIYNLFICQDAQFEFVEGEPDPEFENAEGVNRITFNVNSLIMEAAQRIDEWEWIQKIVPTLEEIYRFTGANVSLDDPLFETPLAGKVLAAVDGAQSVDEIIESSCVNQFEVCKILALLIEPGAVEPLGVSELRRKAEEAVAAGSTQAAVKFLSRLVAVKGDTPGMHRQLGEVFESEREYEKAAFHYRVFAEIQADAGNIGPAFDVYRRIAELLPTDIAAVDRMIEVFAMNPDGLEHHAQEVIERGKQLAQIYICLRRNNRAIQVLHRVVSLGPDDAELRNRLIEVYLAGGMPGEAVAEYEAIAETALATQDYPRAEQIYRKILTIDRSRDDILSRLNQLISRKTQRRRSIRKAVTAGVCCVLFAVLGVVGWRMWNEYRAELDRVAVAADAALRGATESGKDVEAALDTALSEIATNRGSGERLLEIFRAQRDQRAELVSQVSAAVQGYNEVVSEYPGSSAAQSARARADSLSQRLGSLEQGDREVVRSLTAEADELYEVGVRMYEDGARTREQLRQFRRAVTLGSIATEWLTSPNGTDCQDYLNSLQAMIDAFDGASAAVHELLEAGKPDAAFDRALDFLCSYPPPDLADEMPVPVLVRSRPPGAKILADGQDTGLVSPAHVLVSVRRGTKLQLVHEAFEPTEATYGAVKETDPKRLRDLVERSLTVVLTKEVVFRSLPLDGRIDGRAVLAGDVFVVPTRGSHAHLVDRRTGALRGALPTRSTSGVVARPVVYGETVALAAVDRIVTFHDLGTLRHLGQYQAPGEIRADPLLLDNRIILADTDGHVVAVGVQSRTELWRYPAAGQPRLRHGFHASPVVIGSELYAATVDGAVHVLDASTGRALRRLVIGDGMSSINLRGGLVAVGDDLVAVSTDGRLFRVTRDTGRLVWVAPLGVKPLGAPVVVGGSAWIVGDSGFIMSVQLANGAPGPVHDLGTEVEVAPAVDDGVLIVADAAGVVRGFDIPNGEIAPRWEYAAVDDEGTPIHFTAPPSVAGTSILVVGDDRRVRALHR